MRATLPFPTRQGTTLPELILASTLVAVLLALASAPLRSALDVYAVRAAREELAALLSGARAAGRLHGGARVVLDAAAGTAYLVSATGDTLRGGRSLAERHDVRLEAGADVIELEYDALGLGRLASRSITIRRGRARGGVTISSYGRVRTW